MIDHSTARAPITPAIAATVTIALWAGSLVHLLISVATLFKKFPKLLSDVAIDGAPAIFHATEPYHLILGVCAIGATLLWRRRGCSGALKWITWLLMLAFVLAIMQFAIVTPRMDAARAAENRPVFNKLHGVSNVQYLAQTLLLLTSVVLLPSGVRSMDAACTRETDRATRPD